MTCCWSTNFCSTPSKLQRADQPCACALLNEASEPAGQRSQPVGAWFGDSHPPHFIRLWQQQMVAASQLECKGVCGSRARPWL